MRVLHLRTVRTLLSKCTSSDSRPQNFIEVIKLLLRNRCLLLNAELFCYYLQVSSLSSLTLSALSNSSALSATRRTERSNSSSSNSSLPSIPEEEPSEYAAPADSFTKASRMPAPDAVPAYMLKENFPKEVQYMPPSLRRRSVQNSCDLATVFSGQLMTAL